MAVFVIPHFHENPVNRLWLLTCVKNGRSAIEIEPCGNQNAPQDWKLVFKSH
jgi:hypothetical protein